MSSALNKFLDQLSLVDQLISIHGKLQTGRGRRHEQDALHRAGVVLTIAAWQAYNEKVLLEAVDAIDNNLRDPAAPAPSWALQTFELRQAQINHTVKGFNTPNDQNVQRLFLETLGFDPWPSWEWKRGRRQWSVKDVRTRTNTWVKIRHSIAHGFDLPNDVPWLLGDTGLPRLTLKLLKECRSHFVHLTSRMDTAFRDHLIAEYRLPGPW